MNYAFTAAKYSTPGGMREARAILWHMAEGAGTVSYLTHPRNGNSSHFVVEKSGRVVQMVALSAAAWSAHIAFDDNDRDANDYGIYSPIIARGVLGSGWFDINAYCIAVEVEGYRADGPNAAQTAAIAELYRYLRARTPTLRGNLGHRDVQDYKSCPGGKFPWASIQGHGLFKDAGAPALEAPDMIAFKPVGTIVGGILTVTTTTQVIPAGGGARLGIGVGARRHALGVYTLTDLANRRCYLINEEGQIGFIAESVVSFVQNDGPNVGDPAALLAAQSRADLAEAELAARKATDATAAATIIAAAQQVRG